MLAIPALDLKGGACVQIAASTQEVLIRIPDPVGVAAAWRQYGFHNLHVIDLDRAARRGDNDFQIESILGTADAEVDVGGGVRTRDLIQKLLDEGAQRAVVGSRAVEDLDWLEEMSMSFPGRVLVATEVRNRRVLSHGWTRGYSKLVLDLVEELNGLPLGGLLVTTVRAPLALDRPDFPLVEDMVESAEFPIFVGGDVASVSDLRTLADRGVAAVVLGLALYGGAMDPRAIAEEFSA